MLRVWTSAEVSIRRRLVLNPASFFFVLGASQPVILSAKREGPAF
jgi:hypothetical protein